MIDEAISRRRMLRMVQILDCQSKCGKLYVAR